jgi:hypothetical protein
MRPISDSALIELTVRLHRDIEIFEAMVMLRDGTEADVQAKLAYATELRDWLRSLILELVNLPDSREG